MTKMKLKRIIVVLVVTGVAGWLIGGFAVSYQRACSAYRKSRGPVSPSSDNRTFATRGVQYGFSETQVDDKMHDAVDRSGRLKEHPDSPGFIKSYHFVYEPVYTCPCLGKRTILIEEWFWVVFDGKGGAIRLSRSLFIFGRQGIGTVDWDLKTMEPVKGTGKGDRH